LFGSRKSQFGPGNFVFVKKRDLKAFLAR